MTRSRNSHRGSKNTIRSKCDPYECSKKRGDRKSEHHCIICCDLAIHFTNRKNIKTILQDYGIEVSS